MGLSMPLHPLAGKPAPAPLLIDTAALERAYYETRPDPGVPAQVHLLPLPPYSPELNPIERVWNLLRRLRIHNQYFETLDHLVQEVSEQLALWARPNDALKRLCCIT